MCEIDWNALCTETAEHIDLDPTYWMEVEGSFTWHGQRVYFVKQADAIELTVGSETRICGRM